MSLTIKQILAAQAGMENLDTAAVEVPELTPVEQADLQNEVEHARLENEIRENSKEISQLADAIEEVDEDVEELEETVAGLEFLAAQPELNRGAMNYLYHRASKIVHRLGGETTEQVVGNESLESDDVYRAAVVSGCEGFMDTMKKAYNATADFVKSIFYKLLDGIKSLFNISFDQAKKAEKLKEAIKDKEVKTEITLGGWNRFFNGKLSTNDNALKAIGAVIPDFGALLKDFSGSTEFTKETNEKLVKDMLAVGKKFDDAGRKNTANIFIFGHNSITAHRTSDATFIKWCVPYESDGWDASNIEKAINEFDFNVTAWDKINIDSSAKLTGKHQPMITKFHVDALFNTIASNSELVKKLKSDVEGLKSTVDGIVSKLKQGPKNDSGDAEATKKAISVLKKLIAKYSQLVNNYCRVVSNIDAAKLAGIKAHF
ncbi:hypothetical protein [Vibrio phage phiKT1028]|nr:hypothetical protein [Vibrio phage phiKT1028]